MNPSQCMAVHGGVCPVPTFRAEESIGSTLGIHGADPVAVDPAERQTVVPVGTETKNQHAPALISGCFFDM